jgi:hypothetical protein
MTDRPGSTEEEARTRWCPFARTYDAPPAESAIVSGTNRQTGGAGDPCRCLASACMAWRGLGEYFDPTKGHYTERGYCGLAGCLEQPR